MYLRDVGQRPSIRQRSRCCQQHSRSDTQVLIPSWTWRRCALIGGTSPRPTRSAYSNVPDTLFGPHKGHYVNRFVRGIRPPAGWRISPPRFEPSQLRMRCIIRPRVVVPAIQSAPVATHSVATIAHLAFSLAGTILIPDCAPPMRLSPAFFPQLPPAPIHSSGRSLP